MERLIWHVGHVLNDTFHQAHRVIGEYTVSGTIDGWSDNKGGKRIDYIFAHESLSIQTHEVVLDGRHGPIVSDHYGVMVVL